MQKLIGKYQLHETLGEGSFGKVKRATHTETHEAVAIKILDKEKIQAQDMGNQIKKEISIMKMINHPHIVGVKEVFATSTKILMVLELVNGGELFDKIDRQGKLSEEQARYYLRQLCDGLSHCHARGICHRDLKPENLLLDSHGNLKISDFGLSALTVGDHTAEGNARSELLHTTCGSPNYVAPEVLENHGYDGIQVEDAPLVYFTYQSHSNPTQSPLTTLMFGATSSQLYSFSLFLPHIRTGGCMVRGCYSLRITRWISALC